MEEHGMNEQGTSRTKTIVGGLLAAGLALTATVALAARGPGGGDYGVSGYGEDGGYGQKKGHRLHCPSYNGMYHSKGRATCHMAPRRAGVGTGGDTNNRTDGVERDEQETTTSTSAVQARSHANPSAASHGNGRRGPAGPPPGQQGAPHPAPHGDAAEDADVTEEPKEPGANSNKGGNGQKRGHGPKS